MEELCLGGLFLSWPFAEEDHALVGASFVGFPGCQLLELQIWDLWSKKENTGSSLPGHSSSLEAPTRSAFLPSFRVVLGLSD